MKTLAYLINLRLKFYFIKRANISIIIINQDYLKKKHYFILFFNGFNVISQGPKRIRFRGEEKVITLKQVKVVIFKLWKCEYVFMLIIMSVTFFQSFFVCWYRYHVHKNFKICTYAYCICWQWRTQGLSFFLGCGGEGDFCNYVFIYIKSKLSLTLMVSYKKTTRGICFILFIFCNNFISSKKINSCLSNKFSFSLHFAFWFYVKIYQNG